MKSFYKDHENYPKEIVESWNDEVPQHVKNFNDYQEDRNAVKYFALFVEFHLNRTIEILFPDFDYYIGVSKATTSTKINLLDSFKLLPKQIFQSCRCINNIRNEFAHEISISKIDELKNLSSDRRKKTLDKLIMLATEYEGDYDYEKFEDTLRNKFKSLCMNTISAFRIYEPLIRELREKKIDN